MPASHVALSKEGTSSYESKGSYLSASPNKPLKFKVMLFFYYYYYYCIEIFVLNLVEIADVAVAEKYCASSAS